MPTSVRFLTIYVGATLVALLVLMLWPHNSEKLLVIVPAARAEGTPASQLTDAQYFSITANSDVRLLSKVGRTGYVIAVPGGEGNAIVEQLYRKGAFLVLNAANLESCGGTSASTGFRSNKL